MKQKQKQAKSSSKKQEKNALNSFAKYSGLSFQMIAIVLLCVFAGKKLDEYIQWKLPIFTLLLSLLGVFASIYFAVKDFLKK